MLSPGANSNKEESSFTLPRYQLILCFRTRHFIFSDNSPVRSAVESVAYIADHLKNEEDDKQVRKFANRERDDVYESVC